MVKFFRERKLLHNKGFLEVYSHFFLLTYSSIACEMSAYNVQHTTEKILTDKPVKYKLGNNHIKLQLECSNEICRNI